MRNNYIKILEEIATSVAGTMAPFPVDVVGRGNLYKKESKGSTNKAMKNYKFKKNGQPMRQTEVSESTNYEARRAVLDRKTEQINQNTNELIGMNNAKKIVPKVELSAKPKNDDKIEQEAFAKNKEEGKKLLGQAARLYKNVRKRIAQGQTGNDFEDSAAKLGQAILANIKQHNGSTNENCLYDIANMVLEMLINE